MNRTILLALALILALTLAACGGGEEPTPTPQPPATNTPVPAATNTPPHTPVPPTATPAPAQAESAVSPLSTPGAEAVSPLATPESRSLSPLATPNPAASLPTPGCDQELSGAEAVVVAQFPALGCPQGPGEFVFMATQPFEQGRMVWREDEGLIYVLWNQGTLDDQALWLPFADTFVEGDPEEDPALTAPDGRFQPIRGFGKVWREGLGGPDSPLGWATWGEDGRSGTLQVWDGGLLITFDLADRFVLLSNGVWQAVE